MDKNSFWNTQPVGLCDKKKFIPGTISSHLTVENIDKNPFETSENLFWDTGDICYDEISNFLGHNYVEDNANKFRLIYSSDFLGWFLPQGEKNWAVVLREKDTNNIAGFVCAVKRTVNILHKKHTIAEVNLLCLHKSKRKLNLAPLLIKEVTRRVNLCGIFVAIYTSGTYLPQKPFHTTRFFHKFLNLEKLNNLGYTQLSDIKSAIKHYQHKPIKFDARGKNYMHVIRPLKNIDFDNIVQMFEFEESMVLHEVIDHDKLQNMVDSKIVNCFVVEKIDLVGKTRKVVGFISTYNLDILSIQYNQLIKTSYLYYHCGDVVEALDNIFTTLQKKGIDVVNTACVGDKIKLVKTSNMMPGSGILHYYLYNFRLPVIGTNDLSYIVF